VTEAAPRSGRAGDRLLVTGGSGAIGSAFVPLARAEGYDVDAPGRTDLDLFDREAVSRAVAGAQAVVHLATRIRPLEDLGKPELWRENDRHPRRRRPLGGSSDIHSTDGDVRLSRP
jgi:nucleoside-diphosphate-sugar epimerase